MLKTSRTQTHIQKRPINQKPEKKIAKILLTNRQHHPSKSTCRANRQQSADVFTKPSHHTYRITHTLSPHSSFTHTLSLLWPPRVHWYHYCLQCPADCSSAHHCDYNRTAVIYRYIYIYPMPIFASVSKSRASRLSSTFKFEQMRKMCDSRSAR